MKLITSIAALLAVASAGQIYNQPQVENYQNTEAYQPGLEYHEGYEQTHALGGQAYNSRPLAEKTARILSYHSENNVHNYNYGYETENGIKAQEVGQTPHGTQAEGAFSYVGDDGHVYTVQYVADEHGFRAQGAHLPTPPPIPEAILKSLEQNAKDEANGIVDDGQYKEHAVSQGQAYQQYDAAYQQNYHSAAQTSAVETGYH
ncbi:PREDICTED: cuticle protein 3-like [Papilio xuthus]|uniref:Cuticle protein 3-like n=1 Tax=Papilio xuthus TaxID=66420 RepID=A0AAJ7E4Y7_PAPXU